MYRSNVLLPTRPVVPPPSMIPLSSLSTTPLVVNTSGPLCNRCGSSTLSSRSFRHFCSTFVTYSINACSFFYRHSSVRSSYLTCWSPIAQSLVTSLRSLGRAYPCLLPRSMNTTEVPFSRFSILFFIQKR